MKSKLTIAAVLFASAFCLRAAPIAFDEVSFLVRTHETDSFITQQITERRLLRSLSPQQETILKSQGASQTILQALRQPTVLLSESEALAFETRHERARKAIQDAAAFQALVEQAYGNQNTTQHVATRTVPSSYPEASSFQTNAPLYTSSPPPIRVHGIPISNEPPICPTPLASVPQPNVAFIPIRRTEEFQNNFPGYVRPPLPEQNRGVVFVPNGTTQHIGNTFFHSNGTSTTQLGNTYFNSNGTSTQHIGNTYFHSNGTSTQQIGNTFFNSNGTSTQQIGNTYFHSGGSTSQVIGNTIYTR